MLAILPLDRINASNGLFTAGSTAGTFVDTVQAEASQNGITRQGTATVIIGATMTVSVKLQGGLRPYPEPNGYDIPLTIKLYDSATQLDIHNILGEEGPPAVPAAEPYRTFSTTAGEITITDTIKSTKTVTFEVAGLPVGTFNITLFTPHALITLLNGQAIAAQGTSINMGELLEGNADDSVQITGADFTSLLNDYLQMDGDDNWWGGRCDFDRDGQVTSIDFSLLSMNYNEFSPQVQ